MLQSSLRFNGSVWCNLDIALRNLDQLFGRAIQPLGLTIIEWYILRALYERDGQHASELARAVGRAATSFTPNLDKLQQKGFIERRPDPTDRRAVHIYLTSLAEQHREEVLNSARLVDQQIRKMFSDEEFETFQSIVAYLQTLEPDYSDNSADYKNGHADRRG
ncbi:MAG: MarR family transcriptional regulator [Chloroflexi bacterium]|uniref:MarR family winged helix-turn-helix transcriptional regulator n=1 Tax=Candidatus Flexifilum breve TaxID=3140694 RepID=UPI00313707EF|nr:MarR family transcriptional regulator [Chloroflexota bacterium]